jgi:hypothetical protein
MGSRSAARRAQACCPVAVFEQHKFDADHVRNSQMRHAPLVRTTQTRHVLFGRTGLAFETALFLQPLSDTRPPMAGSEKLSLPVST